MMANDMELAQDRFENLNQLVIGSQLSEMELLPPWVESLASAYGITVTAKFAIDLCLEEVVSNVIRHGYSNRPGHILTIVCDTPRPDYLVFTIEDEAAPFNPLECVELPAISPENADRIGGQGLRLLRKFSDTLEYEAIPAGNRLRIGFANSAPVSQGRTG